jgi:hypothetical protein
MTNSTKNRYSIHPSARIPSDIYPTFISFCKSKKRTFASFSDSLELKKIKVSFSPGFKTLCIVCLQTTTMGK